MYYRLPSVRRCASPCKLIRKVFGWATSVDSRVARRYVEYIFILRWMATTTLVHCGSLGLCSMVEWCDCGWFDVCDKTMSAGNWILYTFIGLDWPLSSISITGWTTSAPASAEQLWKVRTWSVFSGLYLSFRGQLEFEDQVEWKDCPWSVVVVDWKRASLNVHSAWKWFGLTISC